MPLSDSSVLIFYVEIEDRGIVAEAFLAEFFHQFNSNQRDAIFSCMLFNAFLHHSTQKVGNSIQPCFCLLIPRHSAFFRRIKCDLDLLTTLRSVETPLIFVQPVTVIDI